MPDFRGAFRPNPKGRGSFDPRYLHVIRPPMGGGVTVTPPVDPALVNWNIDPLFSHVGNSFVGLWATGDGRLVSNGPATGTYALTNSAIDGNTNTSIYTIGLHLVTFDVALTAGSLASGPLSITSSGTYTYYKASGGSPSIDFIAFEGTVSNLTYRKVTNEVGPEADFSVDCVEASFTPFWYTYVGASISGGAAHFDGSATSKLETYSSVGTGATYEVTYTVSAYTSGSILVTGDNGATGTPRSGLGTYTETLICSTGFFYFDAYTSAFVGDIDNVSIVRVSNPYTTVVDTFDSAANWDLSADGITTISGGKLNLNPLGYIALWNGPTPSYGDFIQISYDLVLDGPTDYMNISFGFYNGGNHTVSGTYTHQFTHLPGQEGYSINYGGTGSVDNFTITVLSQPNHVHVPIEYVMYEDSFDMDQLMWTAADMDYLSVGSGTMMIASGVNTEVQLTSLLNMSNAGFYTINVTYDVVITSGTFHFECQAYTGTERTVSGTYTDSFVYGAGGRGWQGFVFDSSAFEGQVDYFKASYIA
jgi:hypothetical protein